MYEKTLDLGRRSRFHRLVLLPLHLGHHGTASRKHRGRARLQPPRPRDLREAHPRRNWTRQANLRALVEVGFFHNILLGIHSLSTAKNVFALVGYSPFDTVGKSS